MIYIKIMIQGSIANTKQALQAWSKHLWQQASILSSKQAFEAASKHLMQQANKHLKQLDASLTCLALLVNT